MEEEDKIITAIKNRRRNECPFRHIFDVGTHCCMMYDGVMLPCNDGCSYMVDYKYPKWLYRLEYKDNTNGLWYNGKGEFCFEKGIGSLDDSCKTKNLPMDYDERYKQDGKDWFSSCSNKEDLLHWYSKEDANELISKGFVFTRYLAVDYHEYEQETVFLKETALKREEIDFNELFGDTLGSVDNLDDAATVFTNTIAKKGWMEKGWSIEECVRAGFIYGAGWQKKRDCDLDTSCEAEAGKTAKHYLEFRFGQSYVDALDDVRMGDELSYAVALFKAGARWQKTMGEEKE